MRNGFGWFIRIVVQDGTMITAIRVNNVTGSLQMANMTEEMRGFHKTENYGTENQIAGMSTDERQVI